MKQTSLPLESTPEPNQKAQSDIHKASSDTNKPVNHSNKRLNNKLNFYQSLTLKIKNRPKVLLYLIVLLSGFILLLAASQWFSQTKQQSTQLDYNQQSHQLTQLLAAQQTLLSHSNLVKQQPELVLAGLKRTAKQLELMSQYPIFKSNFSAFEQELNTALTQQNKIADNLTSHRQTQLLLTERIKTINEAKFNLSQALKPTIERLQTYKIQAEFEKLTVNANRSELFNALNQQQGEEKFEALQASAENYIQVIEASFYIKQSSDLQPVIAQSKALEESFMKALRDFSDMPTRLALKNWYQGIQDNPDLTPSAIKGFNLNRLALEQQLNEDIEYWLNAFNKSEKLLMQINQHKLKNEDNSLNPAILITIICLSLAQIIILLISVFNNRADK